MKIGQIERDGESFYDAALRKIASLPNDEVLTLPELADAIGKNEPTAASVKNKLRPYSHLVCIDGFRKHVYGNPKALAALKKRLASL